jgi:DNA invertase Pin-like site-specific DNA recombinase
VSICYGYGRHSTNKQELTEAAQEKKCKEYYQRQLADKGVEWGGFYYDKATSAKTPFGEREQGRQVFLAARPGDHIVVSKMDRAFRSLRDGITCMDQWSDRGVSFHSLDLQVDTSTPLGRFFRQILLAVAELEREFARERTAEVIAVKKRNNEPYSKAVPAGWRTVGRRGGKQYRIDPVERHLIDRMAQLHEDGMSMERIGWWTSRQKEIAAKRPFPSRHQVRWALSARLADYPLICNYREFNRMVSSGEIALSQPQ